MVETPVEKRGPWLGLESYREEDADRFFGREKETEELLRMVLREVLTVVFGPSGIGKTSLLRAGLFGRLLQESYLPVYVRPTYKEDALPFAEQVRACVEQVLRDQSADVVLPHESGASLWDYLHAAEFWDRKNHLLAPVLFFDQFEEAFRHGEGLEATETFPRELAGLIENYLPRGVAEKCERDGAKIPASYQRQR